MSEDGRIKKYCGSRRTVGHGETEICGQEFYTRGVLHQCDACKLAEAQARIKELEAQLATPAELYTPGRCRLRLIAEGKIAIPRTCIRCGLGPCPLPVISIP